MMRDLRRLYIRGEKLRIEPEPRLVARVPFPRPPFSGAYSLIAAFPDPQVHVAHPLVRDRSPVVTKWLLIFLTSFVFVTTSCAPSVQGDSRAAEEAKLRALDEQWSATAARNDLEGTVAFYANNAVVLPPNAPIATDGKLIRESWAALLGPHNTVSWKASKAEVAASGELGYLYGTYSLALQGPKGGPPVSDTGKFVEIWKKQAGGEWKCIVDTYNSDLPAAPAPETKR